MFVNEEVNGRKEVIRMAEWTPRQLALRLAIREARLAKLKELQSVSSIIAGEERLVREARETMEKSPEALAMMPQARAHAKAVTAREMQIDKSPFGEVRDTLVSFLAHEGYPVEDDDKLFKKDELQIRLQDLQNNLKAGDYLPALDALVNILGIARADLIHGKFEPIPDF
jgi:hypothetical protein